MTARNFMTLPLGMLLLAGYATAADTAQPERSAENNALIENALSAAPANVASGATVKTPDGAVLREGNNGWVCLPDHASQPGNSPRCLDPQYQALMKALQQKTQPQVERVGFGYMLQGGKPGSDTNPFATGPNDPGTWHATPRLPHIMVVVPDTEDLSGLPTQPGSGGPWVMWSNTPYAHLMVPVASSEPADPTTALLKPR
ncbi:conserved exported hypothetical protein [Stutzerimonas xanthomarina]|nr:conserved exported hypothetical protein [Stutzerimonas xanthomarina]